MNQRFVLLCLAVTACGGGERPANDAGPATGSPLPFTGDASAPLDASLPIDGAASPLPGNPSQRTACDDYLDCTLITRPSAYAGALALYGERSACWDTADQSASCVQACASLYEDLDEECRCEAGECYACAARFEDRFYYPPRSMRGELPRLDCSALPLSNPYIESVRVEYEGSTLVLRPGEGDLGSLLALRGTHTCIGGVVAVAGSFRRGEFDISGSGMIRPLADDGSAFHLELQLRVLGPSGADTTCPFAADFFESPR